MTPDGLCKLSIPSSEMLTGSKVNTFGFWLRLLHFASTKTLIATIKSSMHEFVAMKTGTLLETFASSSTKKRSENIQKINKTLYLLSDDLLLSLFTKRKFLSHASISSWLWYLVHYASRLAKPLFKTWVWSSVLTTQKAAGVKTITATQKHYGI